jgi:glycosyltransferase involved in cell wall biosynthesis
MGRIHFVYVKPGVEVRAHGRIARAIERRARAAWDRVNAPEYRDGKIPTGPRPLPTPYSITVRLYRYLRERQETWLYDWRETGMIELKPDDILIGHPHADPETLVQQTLRGGARCRLKALLFPIQHALPGNSEFTLPLIERAALVLGIMGPYWFDTLSKSHFAPWKERIVRLDLAVDATEYPLVKRQFNPPGKRGILYIGRNAPCKGCAILGKTLDRLPGVERGWIGPGAEIPGVPRVSAWAEFTPDYVARLAETYDFFVNMSDSDANPATILEAMAWGFPVACTPQSGYYNMPTIVPLSTTDIAANVAALEELQHAPEERLRELSRANRALVETQYTWERFCATVWKALTPYV